MGTQMTIGYQAMSQACEEILSCHKALTGEKEGLESFLKNLKAEWYGGGSDNWKGVQNDWNVACEDINGILFQLFSALEIALDNYRTADVNIQRLWGG
jgi:WXG100 family type VII secretion target